MRKGYFALGIIIMLVLMAVPIAVLSTTAQEPAGGTRAESVDVPSWYPGDKWWFYEEHVSTTNQPSTQTIKTSNNRTVLEISTVTVSPNTYTCYKVELDGTFNGYGNAQGMDFTVYGTITGYEYYRVNDLAKVKTDIVETAHITMMSITLDETTTQSETWTPPDENYDFPIIVGDSWTLANTWKVSGTSSSSGAFSHQVAQNDNYACSGTESKSVTAGTFNTFKVSATGQDSSTWDRYYNETVGWMVYEYITNRPLPSGSSGKITAGYSELMSYTRIDQNTILNQTLPVKMEYGFDFDVTGRAVSRATGLGIPSKTITIEVPKVAGTFTGTTDASGYFTVTVTAPSEDDATPTTADKGSYGIYTNVNSVPACWVVDTLILDSLPAADLRLRDQDITNDTGGLPVSVGQKVNISAEVYNIGSADATSVSVKFYSGTTFLGEEIIPSIVASSGQQTATYEWTADVEGDTEIIVKVNEAQAILEPDYTNNQGTHWIHAERPFGVNLTCTQASKTAARGNTAEYEFTVKNIGVLVDNIEMQVHGLPAGFEMDFDKDIILLNGGDSTNVLGTLSFPEDAVGAKKHDFQVNATSKGDGNQKAVVALDFTVEQAMGVEMWTKSSFKGALPGAAVSFDIQVNNTGNVEDTYVYSYGNLLPNWIATITPGQTTQEGGASQNITLSVTPDSNADLGTIQTIQFSATSNTQSTLVTYLTLKVSVLEVVSIDMEVDPASESVDPGKDAEFLIALENKGNGAKTIEYTISAEPQLPEDFTVDIASFTKLNPGESKDEELTISVPAGAMARTYTVNISARAKDTALYFNESVTLVVNPAYGIELEGASKLNWDVGLEDTFMIDLVLTNTGNKEDTVDFSFKDLPSTWTAEASGPTEGIVLAPGGTNAITFNITVDDVEVDSYKFSVKAASRGDAAAEALVEFVVTVSGDITPTDDDVVDDDTKDDDKPVDNKSSITWVWVIVILFILLVCFLIIVIVVMAMKKRQPGDTTVIVEPAPTPVEVADADTVPEDPDDEEEDGGLDGEMDGPDEPGDIELPEDSAPEELEGPLEEPPELTGDVEEPGEAGPEQIDIDIGDDLPVEGDDPTSAE